MRRVLFWNRSFYLDDSNGAAVASRALCRGLARHGFATEAVCGTLVDAGSEQDLTQALSARGYRFEVAGGNTWTVAAAGVQASEPPSLRLSVDGVPLTIHQRPIRPYHEPDPAECAESLRLLDAAFERLRPEVLISYGGDSLTRTVFAHARGRGIVTVFALHNFNYHQRAPFADADAVLVASHFSAEHHRAALDLECTVLPYLVDAERVRVEEPEPTYVTFVNPSFEKGVYVFAQIADELGRQRPDIPLLVVEGRGTEETLADCGLDLRVHGTVNLMEHTSDPRDFWAVTRACLLPSLWWENQPMVAVEAMIHGIPVIGSERGGIPETLGRAGIVLPLPERLTEDTRELPTAEEVAPWVDAVIRLWDDAEFSAEQRRRALAEAERWSAEILEPRYVRFFRELRSRHS